MPTQQEKLDQLSTLLNDILTDKNKDMNVVDLSYLKFNGDIQNKGLIWSGDGNTKQFVWQNNPDRFFSSEAIDIGKEGYVSIGGIKVIDENELGPSITKSNIKELGRLKGLIVDGSMSVNNYMFYDGSTDRLSIGTEQAKASITIADDGTEVILGSMEYGKAVVGTYNSTDLNIVTGNTPRITVSASGNIELGNLAFGDTSTLVYGKLGVNVSNTDPRVDLHVNGPIRFNDKIHLNGPQPPEGGSYSKGDIVWNSEPNINKPIGWVCIKEGNPGIWAQFGVISS